MSTNKEYVFPDIHTVARYLHVIKPDIGPVRLHKSLYFLFAYYGALYDSYLFQEKFEAWTSGSVNREVFLSSKKDDYNQEESLKVAVQTIENKPEAKQFIDELFNQIDQVSEFSLISRNKQDASWEQIYKKGEIRIIDPDVLIQEYKERYL